MKLYIFNKTSRGTIYGIGTYIRELTAVMGRHGINVCILNLFSDKPQLKKEEIDGIKYWHFPAPLLELRTISEREQNELYHRNIVYLLKIHIQDRKDLIFHMNFPLNGLLIEGLRQAFDCRIVSVAHFSEWGFTVFDNLPRLRTILNEKHPDSWSEDLQCGFEEERLYYSKADRCICLSKYMQDIVCLDYGLDKIKTNLIPNGLCDIAPTTLIDCRSLRKKWNIPVREKIILFAGRMDEIKGLSYLIEAFRFVLATYPQSRLVIAGCGDFSRCVQDAQDICTKISYTGLLEKKQLSEWYSLADVGVMPSLFEPFGLVAVEMMMHRLPIVITATSGLNEVVDDTCGLKIPIIKYYDKVEIDTKLLAEKILYLLQHPKVARKLGKNGRIRYQKMYTSEVFGQNMYEFYKSLLE